MGSAALGSRCEEEQGVSDNGHEFVSSAVFNAKFGARAEVYKSSCTPERLHMSLSSDYSAHLAAITSKGNLR
ncbi:hypothetical protein ACLOJK_001302 [Asimina triloba]